MGGFAPPAKNLAENDNALYVRDYVWIIPDNGIVTNLYKFIYTYE